MLTKKKENEQLIDKQNLSLKIVKSTVKPKSPAVSNSLLFKNIYRSIPPILVQNSSNTCNKSKFPNIYFGSINLTQTIAEYDHYDMDKIRKLVRYSKTNSVKRINIMRQ
ncbi:unnamed protein product [Rotaria sp. Silwood2]|nr:unnamed protein product [Rotaria sp. Silwood2]CAF2563894.1 unnamed protein product [Rotaria sp. Silwood2]CAF2807768.1 unnamed protein product [Rotaria sp. Silwood2]CAF2968350.1 unnamed protein product [Rotaria sp. Silwood2]CAF3860714.1 unnamed protein product [Rotaria sp. Silwood2]